MQIKNVIFDIGNVLVRWEPYEIIQKILPGSDSVMLYQQMRPVWLDLNLGKLSEKEAIEIYWRQLEVPKQKIIELMNEVKVSQTMIPGSIELLNKLHEKGVNLYSITDNIKEIMEYHYANSNFLSYFKGIVVSAEVGFLKPDPKIYRHLFTKYGLDPAESVFIDDLIPNVEGALSVGMQAFQFTDAILCEKKLKEIGIIN